MVNFNLQDGYSVLTLPKTSPSTTLLNDNDNDTDNDDENNDVSEDRKPMLLDSYNLIQDGHHQLGNEILTATSVLLIHEVQFKHAGNYTCAPSNTRPTNINVHVLKGELNGFHTSLHRYSPSNY